MVNTPGTCRRISVLWTKHSSTNKLDKSETTATTTMKKAQMISAKSMSHSRECAPGLPVDKERLSPTMVTRGASLIPTFITGKTSSKEILSNFSQALSRVLNPASTAQTCSTVLLHQTHVRRSWSQPWPSGSGSCVVRVSAAAAVYTTVHSARSYRGTERDRKRTCSNESSLLAVITLTV